MPSRFALPPLSATNSMLPDREGEQGAVKQGATKQGAASFTVEDMSESFTSAYEIPFMTIFTPTSSWHPSSHARGSTGDEFLARSITIHN